MFSIRYSIEKKILDTIFHLFCFSTDHREEIRGKTCALAACAATGVSTLLMFHAITHIACDTEIDMVQFANGPSVVYV